MNYKDCICYIADNLEIIIDIRVYFSGSFEERFTWIIQRNLLIKRCQYLNISYRCRLDHFPGISRHGEVHSPSTSIKQTWNNIAISPGGLGGYRRALVAAAREITSCSRRNTSAGLCTPGRLSGDGTPRGGHHGARFHIPREGVRRRK